MKLLIVGNGSIGVFKNESFYINNHTGSFLQNLDGVFDTVFVQNTTQYDKDNNLQNFDLAKYDLKFRLLPSKRNLLFIPKLVHLIGQQEMLYLFYPGTLSKVSALIAYFLGKPFGFYIRGQYYKEGSLDRFLLKKAKYILTVSPSIADDLRNYCPVVDVIKPMVSIGTKDIKENRKYVNKSKWRLLFVGRVEYRKGVYELLEIARLLKEKGLDFVLDVVGGGEAFKEIEIILNDSGLTDNVIVHGLVSHKDELKALYDSADLFVFTSHDEGFPRVLYEAMASGLPIFTTFVGGISGRMIDGGNCFEIPVKNAEWAAKVVYDGLQNPDKLRMIGIAGQSMLREVIGGKLLSHDELLIKMLSNDK